MSSGLSLVLLLFAAGKQAEGISPGLLDSVSESRSQRTVKCHAMVQCDAVFSNGSAKWG